jgi:hypothetical protein
MKGKTHRGVDLGFMFWGAKTKIFSSGTITCRYDKSFCGNHSD